MRFSRLGLTTRSLFFTGLLLASPSPAQQPSPPQPPSQSQSQSEDQPVFLLDVLERLQDNLLHYRAAVPSFFCDEHVISEMRLGTSTYAHTTTDSVFRLKRSETEPETPSSLVQLEESREIKFVDNKPVNSDTLTGPAIFYGAFSNALGMVSLSLERCFDYRLIPNQQLNQSSVIVIEYVLNGTPSNSDADSKDQACPSQEPESGKAFIDPKTMQVIRLEMQAPHHEINPGVFGLWTWSIDYAPVSFDNNLFWMPTTIISKAVGQTHSKNTEWSFVATYRNYHKLTVTSHILPDVTDTPK